MREHTTRRFPMRKLALTGLAGLAAFILAAPVAASPVLQIVMKDPGCHWFKVGTKLTTKYVAHGAIAIQNLDEATLKFVGSKGAVLVKVGKTMRFTRTAPLEPTNLSVASSRFW